MITNTELFYARAKTYQERRAAIVATYENRIKSLEATKGSKYYTDEVKKAEDTRHEALTALKNEYSEYFRICFDAMSKANTSRKMLAPTEEELRILQLLKMKDKPTETELEAAAKTLKGNVACLSVLTEISQHCGYLRSYEKYADCKEMSITDADKAIKGLRNCLRDFMEYDTTRAGRIAREQINEMHGVPVGAPALSKRPLFETKAECFDIIAGLSGDSLVAFENAVNEHGQETA